MIKKALLLMLFVMCISTVPLVQAACPCGGPIDSEAWLACGVDRDASIVECHAEFSSCYCEPGPYCPDVNSCVGQCVGPDQQCYIDCLNMRVMRNEECIEVRDDICLPEVILNYDICTTDACS
jgi:hypothetical protein